MIRRIPPARCTTTFQPHMWRSSDFIAERKENGERHCLYLDGGVQGVHLYSRGDFPRIDKIDSLPHLAEGDGYGDFEGTALDGEVLWPQATNLQQTSSFLRMLPANAVAAQRERGLLIYRVFDVIHFNGHPTIGLAYSERRGILEGIVESLGNPYIHLTERNRFYRRQFYHTIVSSGGEGVILKDLRAAYGRGWTKIKKRYDYSTIITGFAPGRGKYQNTLGALRLSVYDGFKQLEVATCSGMTDAERDEFWQHQNDYLGAVVDVFAQEITEGNRLLHPQFHQLRTDVPASDCTLTKLHNDRRVASYWDRQMEAA